MDNNKDNSPQTSEDEALKQELEALAKTFQEELDKAKEEERLNFEELYGAEDDGSDENKTACDSEEENIAEEIPEDELCECCGTNRKGTKKNPDSAYCYDCERALRRYPFDLLNVIIPVIAVALCMYGCYIFANYTSIYTTAQEADKYAKQNKLFSAYAAYQTSIEAMKSEGVNGEMIYKRACDCAYKSGSYVEESIGTDVFKSWELKLPHLKSVYNSYLETMEMDATQSAVSDIFYKYDAEDVKDIPYDKIISEIEALNDQPAKATPLIDGETEEEIVTTAPYNIKLQKYNRAMILYFEFYVSVICEKDKQTQISYLEKIREEFPDKTWIYGAMLGDLYNKTGKDISEIYDKMKQINAEDTSADVIKATSLRINGEYDDAIKLCNRFIDRDDTYVYEFLRQKSICYLLKGDKKAAYQFAYDAYTESTIPLTANLLMICSIATNNTEVYDEVAELFTSNEMEISSEVLDFKDGKISANDIFTKGDFDVA